MLRSSLSSVSLVDDRSVRSCPDFRTAASEKFFLQQQQQTTMIQFASLEGLEASTSCSVSRSISIRAASNLKVVSWPGGLKNGFDNRLGGLDSLELSISPWRRESRMLPVVGATGNGDRSLRREEEEDVSVATILDRVTLGQRGNTEDEVVEVQIEKLGNNSRKIVAKIVIEAPLENVWALLTDYEHLADFIPGLAVNELLEKRDNGARLYQVGEQNLALGVKFKAKAVVDCEEKPTKVHEDCIQRDIDFETIEGDFQVFRGTWRMEQPVSKPSSASGAPAVAPATGDKIMVTILSYILVVQPKMWLPVGLVEGRLTSEMKKNLVCIRERTRQPSAR